MHLLIHYLLVTPSLPVPDGMKSGDFISEDQRFGSSTFLHTKSPTNILKYN